MKQPALNFNTSPVSGETSLPLAILNQIARDTEALKDECSPWWREFFAQRIADYRQWYLDIQHKEDI